MSGARKLQTEIDRVMKKVDEGVTLFDEIWEKVYTAEQQNQKEKYEMDLKKEIKKLQRLRDQIKTWIGSSEVKDKDALLDARRLIETKMEQFKVCEKETKTKTYSKEGLARAEKLDPVEEAKMKCMNWISQNIDLLNQLIDDRDVEIERLSTGKGKKTNKHIIEEYNGYITNHKFHVNKLEGIMRLVNNDLLDVALVDELKEDMEYYIEAHEDDEYIQAYDEEIFYEALGLEELDVVNVDRVTHVQPIGRSKSSGSSAEANDNSSEAGSKSSKKEKSSKKSSSSSSNTLPLTIGRARSNAGLDSTEKDKPSDKTSTPRKGKSSSNVSDSASVSSGKSQPSNALSPSVPSGVLGPAPSKVTAPPQGASMAAILKREGEQQEKERKAALQQQQQIRDQQVRAAQAEQLRQQQLQRQQQDQLRHQEALRQQQQQQEAARQEALKRQQQQLHEERARQQIQEAAAKQQQIQAPQPPISSQQQSQFNQQQIQQQQPLAGKQSLDNLLPSGLGGLSLGNSDSSNRNSPEAAVTPQQQNNTSATQSYDLASSYLGALNESYLHCPNTLDSERQRTYTPRNPYPTPACYPATPSPLFDHPSIFEKLGTDCLFFIFYYAQGTYQQYLAARELKKQSWRYHKKYMTWFQRHEEPKITTDEYEQGTYVYFDYETGWCQRIKSDFRFEYSYLEDSLII